MWIGEVLIWIFFGALSGVTSKWILPAKHEPQGCLLKALIGILGAVVGGVICKQLWPHKELSFDYYSLIGAIVGGTLFSIVYQLLPKRK